MRPGTESPRSQYRFDHALDLAFLRMTVPTTAFFISFGEYSKIGTPLWAEARMATPGMALSYQALDVLAAKKFPRWQCVGVCDAIRRLSPSAILKGGPTMTVPGALISPWPSISNRCGPFQ